MFEIFGFIWIIESVFEVGVCLIDDQIGPTFLIRADTLVPTLFTLEQKVALDKGDLLLKPWYSRFLLVICLLFPVYLLLRLLVDC